MTERLNIQAIRENMAQKAANARQRKNNQWRQADADAKAIIAMIARHYPVTRIYQWGSVLHADHFSEISDIDIAVEGPINAPAFFEMFGKADDMTNFPLDLAQMEKIHPLHAESIRKKGRLVYERIQ